MFLPFEQMFNKIDDTGALFQAATFEYQALSSATSLKSAMKRFEKSPVGASLWNPNHIIYKNYDCLHYVQALAASLVTIQTLHVSESNSHKRIIRP